MNSVISMPSGAYKYAWRTHRLVVLPDFQGLSMGTKINNFFGEYYINQGYKYFIRTTHVRLRRHLANNKNWRETSSSDKQQKHSNTSKLTYDTTRIAASFEYVGPDYATKPHKTLIVDDDDTPPTIDELKKLKDEFYLTVVTGRHKVENETEKACRTLGIRTQLLYITQKGVTRRVKYHDQPTSTEEPKQTNTQTQKRAPATKKPAVLVQSRTIEPYMPTGERPILPSMKPRDEGAIPTIPIEQRRVLYTDIETYSGEDIRRSGAYKYMEHPDFEIMLLAYAWDDEPVRVIDFFDPFDVDMELQEVLDGLNDPNVLKISHNAAFERNAYKRQFGHYMPSEEWIDTMILCAMNGLPMSLDEAGAALQLQNQKIKEGTTLINYFCKPCNATIANGGRTRNLPIHAMDKWDRFKRYAERDVVTMRDIYKRLQKFPVTDFERKIWALDNRINERGVLVDTAFAEAAVAVDDAFTTEHSAEMQRLTGLDNPNSVAQLKSWLETVNVYCESLNKETVDELQSTMTDRTTKRVLELRKLLGKTSTKKYQAMLAAACGDDRVRGLLQYYGAGRTGRWSGRLVQIQNLPQNHLDAIEEVRELVRDRDLEYLEFCYKNVPDVLSQLIRTAFIAKPGHTFLVTDYSAIEARVIAYLAGEKWRQEVFAGDGKIYEASYSKAFNVPVESVVKGSPERQKGKIMELALGYGGGVNALVAFGADKLGLTQDEMQGLVNAWRLASPTIPQFWRDAETAARSAIQTPGRTFTLPCGVKYRKDADALRCRLPSGRILSYWNARVEDRSIVFMGQNQMTRKWEKTETWGGKLVENIVQAYARDCLAVALLRLEEAGYNVVFHVHDEIIAEVPEDRRWEDMSEIMSQPIEWAPGLLLRGDGYETKFYKKD
jgi:DNA polymerase